LLFCPGGEAFFSLEGNQVRYKQQRIENNEGDRDEKNDYRNYNESNYKDKKVKRFEKTYQSIHNITINFFDCNQGSRQSQGFLCSFCS
jgi:hypothetical protein